MSKRVRQDSNPFQNHTPHHPSSHDTTSTEETNHHPGKYTHLAPSSTSPPPSILHCTLPPHAPLGFPSYSLYETHYLQSHTHRCHSCLRNFPSDHYLNLHIAEYHDPITASRRERGEKTYQCFVEGCDKLCSAWQKRRMHLVDKHGFPREYDFFVVRDGCDGRTSLLRSERSLRKSSLSEGSGVREEPLLPADADVGDEGQKKCAPNQTHGKSKPDVEMDDIAQSMAALKFVPKSVTFGRRKGGGLAKS